MDIHERFEKVADDYLRFEKVENKRSTRPDLNAFLLLNEISPGTSDIINAAEHDEFYLDIKEDVIENLTGGQILELVRCGVRHSSEYDCLCMFA